MARLGARARSRPWAVLVLVNILPIGASICILWGYRAGTITFRPGSEAVVPSLVVLAALILAMLLLSWVAAPLLRGAVTAAHGFVQGQTTAIARGGVVAFFVRFPALVGGMLVYGVLVVNVVLLGVFLAGGIVIILISLAVFAAEVMRVRG
ncbi:MAG: hypothetical protein ACYS9X_10045 [Planctomycetota bacterium]|jgi:hypothetical protein